MRSLDGLCNPLFKIRLILLRQIINSKKLQKNYPMMSMKQFIGAIEWAFKKGDIFQSIDNKNLFKDSKKLKKNILNVPPLLFIQKTFRKL